MNRLYALGRLQGLRDAAELMRSLEQDVSRRLDRPAGRATREARKVRHKSYGVAAKRIETVVRRAERASSRSAPLSTALKELGLG